MTTRLALSIALLLAACGDDDSSIDDGSVPDADDAAEDAPDDGDADAEEPFGNEPKPTIIAGDGYTVVLLADGRVLAWGANGEHQLGGGLETTSDELAPIAWPDDDVVFASLSAASSHACSTTDLGEVRCWGANPMSVLGADTGGPSATSFEVPGLDLVVAAATMEAVSFAIDDEGTLYSWGSRDASALGREVPPPGTTPSPVDFDDAPRAVDGGRDHACAATITGEVHCWGSNSNGALGRGDTAPAVVPVPRIVDGVEGAIGVTAGDDFTCVWTEDGRVFCWGKNDWGQLGRGTSGEGSGDAEEVVFGDLEEDEAIVELSAEYQHTCALSSAGRVFCWGNDADGAVGDGDLFDGCPGRCAKSPTLVAVDDAVSVAAGHAHGCALTESSEVYCWGLNAHGEVGDGTTTTRNAPIEVALP